MSDKNRRVKQVITFIILILIILLYFQILQFSSKPAEISAQQSISVSQKIVFLFDKIIPLKLSEEQLSGFERYIRKAAHFLEYALLGFLIYSLPLIWGKKEFRQALNTLLVVGIMASLDELLQLFVPGRAGLVTDVLIDCLGCIFGILFMRLILKFYISWKARKLVKVQP